MNSSPMFKTDCKETCFSWGERPRRQIQIKDLDIYLQINKATRHFSARPNTDPYSILEYLVKNQEITFFYTQSSD